jgi:RNA polymerase sigma factor (sigma-70 family)
MVADSIATLVDWLDGRGGTNGDAYVAMHARLVAFFSRKGCRPAEDLADETLLRVARRLREEGGITNVPPAQYCYIVARFVFLEYLRRPERTNSPMLRDLADPDPIDAGHDERERLLSRLDECLAELDPDDRALLLEYYAGTRADRITTRKALAARLGLSANALTIRACRLRERVRADLDRRLAAG